jgi:hypothetical protein
MLEIYCTPGSGRWYENVACYYQQSLKCWCNLAIHLARHGLLDPASVPRMKEFLSWGIIALTAPLPADYAVMREGVDADTYRTLPKTRRIPPIGDHAHLGSWVPEHVAIMAHFFRESDPAFADFLRWAFHSSGADGGYYSVPQLFFTQADALDMTPPEGDFTLASRRLEGFGVVFRGNVNQEDEFYLLLKQGPGGYRYHRTEGSILLVADGKPLVYDGGEAGEAWRHTTLSFYDTHTMLAPGHVERFHSFPTVDFAQGVHPLALSPGEPDYLCNSCRHELVEVAYQRYNEPHPADIRSVIWVKDAYVILHDELHIDPAIPTHWHLQAVAQHETGDLQEGFRFAGRFGTDLQVLLPGVAGHATVEYVPIVEPYMPPDVCFGMRHLQVSGTPGTDHYLAVLRPLPAGGTPVQATPIHHGGLTVGVMVLGVGVADHLFFHHDGMAIEEGDLYAFSGRYGAVLQRPDGLALALLDGACLTAANITLSSTGPAAWLQVTEQAVTLVTEGRGEIVVQYQGIEHRVNCPGEQQTIQL